MKYLLITNDGGFCVHEAELTEYMIKESDDGLLSILYLSDYIPRIRSKGGCWDDIDTSSDVFRVSQDGERVALDVYTE